MENVRSISRDERDFLRATVARVDPSAVLRLLPLVLTSLLATALALPLSGGGATDERERCDEIVGSSDGSTAVGDDDCECEDCDCGQGCSPVSHCSCCHLLVRAEAPASWAAPALVYRELALAERRATDDRERDPHRLRLLRPPT